MTNNQMISFPRELGDELAEMIAEKARVCGGGAFDIWEAICEQFGTPAAQPQGGPLSELEVLRAAVTELEALRDARVDAKLSQGEPVVLIELVENKTYGGMHIAKWDNPGRLKEGFHRLYAEQPAPVAVVLPERREPKHYWERYGKLTVAARVSAEEWDAYNDELKRLNPSL